MRLQWRNASRGRGGRAPDSATASCHGTRQSPQLRVCGPCAVREFCERPTILPRPIASELKGSSPPARAGRTDMRAARPAESGTVS